MSLRSIIWCLTIRFCPATNWTGNSSGMGGGADYFSSPVRDVPPSRLAGSPYGIIGRCCGAGRRIRSSGAGVSIERWSPPDSAPS